MNANLRDEIFAKAGAALRLERLSDDVALVRLDIGNLTFGIGQPRNGLEAASVMRTFRDALTRLLAAAATAPGEMISAYNLLRRDRDRLREVLARLHDWALAQQGDCMFSGDHPIAQAAAALTGMPAPIPQAQPE